MGTVSVWQDEKSSGERLHNMNTVSTINCTLKTAKMVILCIVYFATIKNFLKGSSIYQLDFVIMAKTLLSRNGDMKGRWNKEQFKYEAFCSGLKEKI